jgi:hypothetical protein
MAYDAASRQMLLFGADYGNSTWVWSGTSWSQVDDGTDLGCTYTCSASPPDRNVFGIAYDAASGRIIVFGGDGGNDTWAWDGSSWSQIAAGTDHGCTTSCPLSPPDNIGAQMAYDPATKQIVLFGGGAADYDYNLNDTWTLSYHGGSSYAWSQVADSTDKGCTMWCTDSPPDRNVPAMAYDTATQQLVLFGGELTAGDANGQNDTWVWTGSTWSQVDNHNTACGQTAPAANPCADSPSGRVGASMVFDPAIGDLILFGGMDHYNNPEYDDTWAWNGSSWNQIDNSGDATCSTSCSASPTANDTYAFADDAKTNTLVLFGGTEAADATWTAPAVPAAPSAPTHLKAVTHTANVVVSWSAPQYLGASSIKKYVVKTKPARETCLVIGTTTCTLGALSPSTRYTITVTASNSVGMGAAATVKNVKG